MTEKQYWFEEGLNKSSTFKEAEGERDAGLRPLWQ
jgi:hypothetical protein